MMTKEELKRYQDLTKEQAQIEEMLAEFKATKADPKGTKTDATPRGSSILSGLEAKEIRQEALEAWYEAKKNQISETRLAIEKAIDGLTPTERRLMRLRYIDGLTWEEVCIGMTYSWRQTHRIHGRALKKLRETEETRGN